LGVSLRTALLSSWILRLQSPGPNRLKPDYASAFNNRGNARQAQGDLAGAVRDYDEAIRLKPDYATAFNNRGEARQALRDVAGAQKDFDEAVRRSARLK